MEQTLTEIEAAITADQIEVASTNSAHVVNSGGNAQYNMIAFDQE
jgi:hypothetical protein